MALRAGVDGSESRRQDGLLRRDGTKLDLSGSLRWALIPAETCPGKGPSVGCTSALRFRSQVSLAGSGVRFLRLSFNGQLRTGTDQGNPTV